MSGANYIKVMVNGLVPFDQLVYLVDKMNVNGWTASLSENGVIVLEPKSEEPKP